MSAILEAMSTRVRATFAFALLAAASASVPARGDDAQDAVDFIRHKDYFGNCRPADNIYDSAGCCGTPGYRGCALAPLCVTPPKSNLLRGFGCNLPDPDCSDGLVARAMIGTGNTFILTSDIHFFRQEFSIEDQVYHVGQINAFAGHGYSWRSYFGLPVPAWDVIAEPRAVIVNGDLTLDSTPGALGAFRLLYERGTTKASIAYPVIFGLGNHEIRSNVNGSGNAKRMFDYLLGRMECSTVSVDDQSDGTGSGNYSFEWNGAHFVQLNNYARGQEQSLYKRASDGIKWLKNDLQTAVGSSGRPVILLQHQSIQGLSNARDPKKPEFWIQQDAWELWDAVKDYNVVGVFDGDKHTHSVGRADRALSAANRPADPHWPRDLTDSAVVDSTYRPKLFEEYRSGSGGDGGQGDFIVARLQADTLDVGTVEWKGRYLVAPVAQYYDGSDSGKGCRRSINHLLIELNSTTTVTPVATTSGKAEQTFTVRRQNFVPEIPGPVALRIPGLVGAAVTNRSYVDSCTPPASPDDGLPQTAAYVELTAAQLKELNSTRRQVDVTVKLASAQTLPTTINVAHVTPIKQAYRVRKGKEIKLASNRTDASSYHLWLKSPADVTAPQRLIVTGRVGKPIQVSVSYTTRTQAQQSWLKASAPAVFDAFGRAAIDLTFDHEALKVFSGQAVTAEVAVDMLIAGQPYAMQRYLFDLEVRVTDKEGAQVGLSIAPALMAKAGQRPIFTATLDSLAVNDATNDGPAPTVTPTGTLTLGIIKGDAKHAPVFTPLSRVNVGQGQADCNGTGIANTYVFNYKRHDDAGNPHNLCPSLQLESDSDFSLDLPGGAYLFQVRYSGDSFHAAASSPALPYVLPAAPAVVNLARTGGAKARQSSTRYAPSGVAALAIDGNSDPFWDHGSVTHTSNSNGEWLEIDLGQSKPISQIVVFNRGDDCCVTRIYKVKVEVAAQPCDQPKAMRQVAQEWNLVPAGTASDTAWKFTVSAPTPISGRYVCLRQPDDVAEYLSVAEVQVMGSGN